MQLRSIVGVYALIIISLCCTLFMGCGSSNSWIKMYVIYEKSNDTLKSGWVKINYLYGDTLEKQFTGGVFISDTIKGLKDGCCFRIRVLKDISPNSLLVDTSNIELGNSENILTLYAKRDLRKQWKPSFPYDSTQFHIK